ncbi:MAG: GxxExxY protein [Gammaproteobacteria bacterium]|uniref:GxxExxY protein n=1 Tax=Candidatus Palauibacter soopunensis TaxID=3056739 RepID=UPI0023A0B239|nr:GxxExxY protein [Candidatus Palauibacter soopunensis]MDE0357763.1 GxxExxY protein [Gammaproteobacteria bacterium]MDE2878451.1 GxxExxY protein [Candidatus Palauibacter soopunensis]
MSEAHDLAVVAAETVYSVLGGGYPESVYEKAMAVEFRDTVADVEGFRYSIERNVEIMYRDRAIGLQRLDFDIELDGYRLAVELKAGTRISASHKAQTRAYLRTTGYDGAVIINFPPDGTEIESCPISSSEE